MRLKVSFLALLLLAVLTASGCIRSRLLITSDPPGATVFFQDQERGDTPIWIPFIWYWYYEVRVEKEGYKPLRKIEYLAPRPWTIMPLDIFAELIPVTINDGRERHYVLEPLPAFPAGGVTLPEPLPAGSPLPVPSDGATEAAPAP